MELYRTKRFTEPIHFILSINLQDNTTQYSFHSISGHFENPTWDTSIPVMQMIF